MSAFPDEVVTPRTISNRPGVSFDPDDTKTFFAEDLNAVNDEIVAIETELGVNPAGAFATVKAWLTNLSDNITALFAQNTGWIPVSDSWSYASASTITVPTGAASKYSVGDKIKLTQTTVKYFVIKSVSNTVLTVLINTDYTVANAAISAISFSKANDPVGFPAYFSFAPAASGFSGTPTQWGKYKTCGRMINIMADIQGTSNGPTIVITTPVALPQYQWVGWQFQPSINALPCLGEDIGGRVKVYKDGAVGDWASSGSKRVLLSYSHMF